VATQSVRGVFFSRNPGINEALARGGDYVEK
jgi:hypothetical protein